MRSRLSRVRQSSARSSDNSEAMFRAKEGNVDQSSVENVLPRECSVSVRSGRTMLLGVSDLANPD